MKLATIKFISDNKITQDLFKESVNNMTLDNAIQHLHTRNLSLNKIPHLLKNNKVLLELSSEKSHAILETFTGECYQANVMFLHENPTNLKKEYPRLTILKTPKANKHSVLKKIIQSLNVK